MRNLLERCFFPENQLNVFYLLAPQFFSRSVARVADVQQVREMKREGGWMERSFDLSSSKFSTPIKTATDHNKKDNSRQLNGTRKEAQLAKSTDSGS